MEIFEMITVLSQTGKQNVHIHIIPEGELFKRNKF